MEKKDSILTVQNLTKTFYPRWSPFKAQTPFVAVDDVSFNLNKGEILGFLGPNGAGKTTTIQMLLGNLRPTSGSINYFGNNFAQHRRASLKKIGYASGYDKLPARLTVLDNLDIVGRIYGVAEPKRSERIQELLQFFGIWHLKDRATGTLSAGQATRVMLTKAFIARPDIVLLDEPTAALDPDIAYAVRQFILQQRQERGVSILITSHNMAEVTELCDRVLVIKNGSLIANNTPDELAQSTSKVRVHFIFTNTSAHAMAFLRSIAMPYSMEDNYVTIELDEQDIARFLMTLAQNNITYSHISIDKPTLEDYFLSVVSTQKEQG